MVCTRNQVDTMAVVNAGVQNILLFFFINSTLSVSQRSDYLPPQKKISFADKEMERPHKAGTIITTHPKADEECLSCGIKEIIQNGRIHDIIEHKAKKWHVVEERE